MRRIMGRQRERRRERRGGRGDDARARRGDASAVCTHAPLSFSFVYRQHQPDLCPITLPHVLEYAPPKEIKTAISARGEEREDADGGDRDVVDQGELERDASRNLVRWACCVWS